MDRAHCRRFRPDRLSLALTVVMGVLAGAAPAGAQTDTLVSDPADVGLSRSQLEKLAVLYRGYSESIAYSDSLRAMAASELGRIGRRLSEGDFSEGDVVSLQVQGEDVLTDTFVVSPQRTVSLPQIGAISLHGVLRSELTEHIQNDLARMVRDPRVTAVPMVRLAVLGAVNSPGFYIVPAGTPLAELLMTAGGPMATADTRGLRIERQGNLLLAPGPEDQRLTVGQMNLRSGDQIVMPAESQSVWQRLQTNVMTVLPMITLVLTMYLQLNRQP